MEGNENLKTPESETKKADYMRKELEQFAFIKSPVEQWSDMEKESFLKWCRQFNNFCSITAPSALMEEGQEKYSDSRLYKDILGMSDEEIAKSVECGNGSEKYFNSTPTQFYRDIKHAFINSGVDIEELRSRLKRNEELWKIFIDNPEKFLKDESFEKERKERVDNLAHFFIATLPAILALIDSGYTRTELSR